MSEASQQRAREFLQIAPQFQLGALVTESFHPITANLSDVAAQSTAEGLRALLRVDDDVLEVFRAFVASGRARTLAAEALVRLRGGGRMFFTGCGSTGRLSIQLDSIWRDHWQRAGRPEWEDRTFSVMAGGDFALIKSVEGFEDFTQFGRRQIADLGVCEKDMVFAITEGGETSFVIGTAWQGLDAGAKVVFVYNNPDDVLRATVERSREVIDEARIEKLNLTTGPMAISGSTRMQATTIQQLVVLTVLEIVARDLVSEDSSGVETRTLAGLEAALGSLRGDRVIAPLARLVEMEANVYRNSSRNNYYAGDLGIDVLTDTTERSPTYCTPPFRKCDDRSASESWAFLFVPQPDAASAWRHILKRAPRCVEWPESDVRAMTPPERADRTVEVLSRIGLAELMRFHIGEDGVADRPIGPGHAAVGVIGPGEALDGFVGGALDAARSAGAEVGLIAFGSAPAFDGIRVEVPLPDTDLWLGAVARATAKMLLNALSTCTMVRLGRVMGNVMVWVVPSNLKLIDRAIRYVRRLTGLEYEAACELVHEAIEYVAPRMLADQAYPPVVELCVARHRQGLSNEDAEAWLGARASEWDPR